MGESWLNFVGVIQLPSASCLKYWCILKGGGVYYEEKILPQFGDQLMEEFYDENEDEVFGKFAENLTGLKHIPNMDL